jgi:5-methylcytosine-specific restriction endonuclease McrA
MPYANAIARAEYRKKYKIKNRHKWKDYNKAYRQKHKSEITAYGKNRRLKNISKILEREADYRKKNAANILEAYQAKKHLPEFKAAKLVRSQKRRALKMKATVNLKAINEFIRRVKSKPTVVCYYCDSVVPTNAMHFDHIIPLIKGGPHSVENLCASCPTCNLTKNASTIKAWFKMGQQILNL